MYEMFCGLIQHYSGLEEAVFRNIRACKELSQTTRTAYGPNGKHPFPAKWDNIVLNHCFVLF